MTILDEYREIYSQYREKGLAGRVGFGKRPCLLIVDMIRAFTDGKSPLAGQFDEEISTIKRLISVSREREIPIIFSTVEYDSNLHGTELWIKKIPSLKLLVEGTKWVIPDERFKKRDSEIVLVKKYASCFFGTELMSYLMSQGLDTLVVTGCTTSGCVRATVIDSCSFGLHTIIAEDGVGDRAELPHVANLFDMDSKYGDVMKTDAIIDILNELND